MQVVFTFHFLNICLYAFEYCMCVASVLVLCYVHWLSVVILKCTKSPHIFIVSIFVL